MDTTVCDPSLGGCWVSLFPTGRPSAPQSPLASARRLPGAGPERPPAQAPAGAAVPEGRSPRTCCWGPSPVSGAVTGRRGPRGDRAWRTPADPGPLCLRPAPAQWGRWGRMAGLRNWVLPPRVSWALRCPQVRARNRTGISRWRLPVLLSVLLSGLCAQSTPRGLASVCRAPCPAAEGGDRSAALVSAEKSSRSRRLLLDTCLGRGPPSCRPRALSPDPTGRPPPALRPAASARP